MKIRIASAGHAAFSVTMIALGVVVLLKGFTPIWTGVPKAMPARTVLATVTGIVSAACGAGLLIESARAAASRVLLAYLVLWFLAFRLALVVRDPGSSGNWWACGESAVMVGAAWVLVAWFPGAGGRDRLGILTGERGVRIGRTLYGLGLIPFGVAHFTFLERTVSLVPGWLPWHLGWAYATGAAFIAAGLAVLTGVLARPAAALVALQMGLFTLIVWVPSIMTGPNEEQWLEFVESCVLTVAGWVVADSWRGTPWLAVRNSERAADVENRGRAPTML